ncbi:MAG: low molecular weight phosphotyrosine protein phosphatase, partial [Planctomycetes bacterium]|nr:low molecular weight phosphotyrosine protein phosphatase [Planctomycetota bacterium]
CSGNICRSPMAAAVLRDRLERLGRSDVEVSSAGTLGIVGETAEPLAARVAGEAGYDLSSHRSRALGGAAVRGADLVLVMEESHAAEVRELAKSDVPIFLVGSFLDRAGRETRSPEIDDPMGRDEEAFRECLRTIEEAVDRFVEEMIDSDPSAGPGSPAEQRFFAAIGDPILKARGGAPGLTSLEFHMVDSWWKRRWPLWLVLEALTEAEADWPRGEAPRGFIHSVAREVDRRAREAGLEGSSIASRRGGGGGDPEESLEDLAGDLRAAARRVGGAHPRLRETLRSAARALGSRSAAPADSDAQIRKWREAVVAAARESLPLGALEQFEADERGRLRGLSGRLSPGATDETLQRLVEDRLLAYFDLPRVGLLDAGAGSRDRGSA